MTLYDAACAAIDRANAEDPKRHELPYSKWMVVWAGKLATNPSEELLLAVRAQHLRRWTLPRSNYPEGLKGYLEWRETLKKLHADQLGSIMKAAGYGEPSIAKARGLILRKNLSADPEGQMLEDAACLVFLEHEFADFAGKTAEEKVVDILRKTWEKMSSRARELALQLPLGKHEGDLVRRALGGALPPARS